MYESLRSVAAIGHSVQLISEAKFFLLFIHQFGCGVEIYSHFAIFQHIIKTYRLKGYGRWTAIGISGYYPG